MNDPGGFSRSISSLIPQDSTGFDKLVELALNLRWSWNHETDDIWRQLDAALWTRTRNPWVVLQTASRGRIDQLLAQADFRERLDDLIESRRKAIEEPAWFQRAHPQAALSCVAYFSMEFMLSEALPIYSGGLGNVAGDQLKTASDLGVPVVGIGLLFQQGYFRQVIDKNGEQQALYPYNDPGQLPIRPLRSADGEWLRLEIELPGSSVWLRAWQVQVGRVRLLLLDSNDASNLPIHRAITSELYGGGPELRLTQELILGIGGWRLLEVMGLQPEVCHLNEGHAAFAVLERARCFMKKSGQSFETAIAATRAGNLFTTHTAVPAGFDQFEPALIEQYLGVYATQELAIPFDDLLALGRIHARDPHEAFNMARLAIRCSGAVNGVSRLHGEVSRRLFSPMFPRWPLHEIPVGYVTNGVHMPTWDSPAADELWTEVCGKERWRDGSVSLQNEVHQISDEDLWQLRTTARRELIDYLRCSSSQQLAAAAAKPEVIHAAKHLFDPDVLTIGFARRFAEYKRPNLLLHDPARLLRLLCHPQRPVQIVIAGKAHPNDGEGQALIRQWIEFIRQPQARPHIVFLDDYDMLMGEHLVQGVDVWLNTPRRPWEASGTSGMKVLVNGGINLSELDGWWAEAWTPQVGWALGDGQEHGNDPAWDARDAEALYGLLESEVIPQFYDRNDAGLSPAWTSRMRESMATLTPRFSATRTVRQYTDSHYLPAALALRARLFDNGMQARQIADWQRGLAEHWPGLRFGACSLESEDGHLRVEVAIDLGGLDPATVTVELYADAAGGMAALRQPMTRELGSDDAVGQSIYRTSVITNRPAADHTVRVVPFHPCAAIPLEAAQILWKS